jgi:hypothetical protein
MWTIFEKARLSAKNNSMLRRGRLVLKLKAQDEQYWNQQKLKDKSDRTLHIARSSKSLTQS